jgi:hypothetical protein
VPIDDRQIGSDFSRKDGWSMYHGDTVPGFPGHPHRGFETVTLVRKGLIDHSDSLGAAARFGGGDVQWVTAGKGIVHSEMFPLLNATEPNPLELFQIWLNLPARNKMVEPHFTMLWNERIPRLVHNDAAGHATTVTVVAGALPGAPIPLAPPPESWASQPEGDVAIWTLRMEPGAQWTLPAAQGQGTRRMLYFFGGDSLRVGPQDVGQHAALELVAGQDWPLTNTGAAPVECLLLQGQPIGDRGGTAFVITRGRKSYGHERLPPHPVWRLAWPSRTRCAPRRGSFLRATRGRRTKRPAQSVAAG